MAAKNYHVTKRHDGRWQVKGEGNTRATAIANTQAEAIEIGKTYTAKQGSKLFVHRPDGKIRNVE